MPAGPKSLIPTSYDLEDHETVSAGPGQLPREIQRQAREAYKLFRNDPRHLSLRFKKVHATQPVYSARINTDVRAVGVMNRDEIVWFWIGPHGEYEKLLKQL